MTEMKRPLVPKNDRIQPVTYGNEYYDPKGTGLDEHAKAKFNFDKVMSLVK
jgi:hypothetical protein